MGKFCRDEVSVNAAVRRRANPFIFLIREKKNSKGETEQSCRKALELVVEQES